MGPYLQRNAEAGEKIEHQPIIIRNRDLLAIDAKSPEEYGRKCALHAYSREEVKSHMMSPGKGDASTRPEFSPVRKNLIKSMFLVLWFIRSTNLLRFFL